MPLPGSVAEVGDEPGEPLLGRGQRAARPSRSESRASPPRSVMTSWPPAPSCSATSVDHARVGGRRRREHRGVGGQRRRAGRGCGGSRGGSRGPSRGRSAPRRPRAGRSGAARSGSCSSRNRGLLSRSGLTSSTSTSSAASAAETSPHSSALAEFIVTARMPARAAAATWSRISASSGETIRVGAGALRAAQRRRDEVDRRLAPPGALHDEDPAAVAHERLRPPRAGRRGSRRRRGRRACRSTPVARVCRSVAAAVVSMVTTVCRRPDTPDRMSPCQRMRSTRCRTRSLSATA